MNNPGYRCALASTSKGIACIEISGEIDIAAQAALDAICTELSASPQPAVYVDLAGIQFAGATLINFLYHTIACLPPETPVLLCRSHGLTGEILHLCALDAAAEIIDTLPTDFLSPFTQTADISSQ